MTQTSLSPRAWLDMALLASDLGGVLPVDQAGLGGASGDDAGGASRRLGGAGALGLCAVAGVFALPRDARVWGAFLVMGVLNNAIPFGLMAWGQQFIETGLTSIFNAATAVFGVLVAAPWSSPMNA
jgi:drug/metabolite transporter (DMT)-like permease